MADQIPRKLVLELIEKNFGPTASFAPSDLLDIIKPQLESQYPTLETIDNRVRAHLWHLTQAGILHKIDAAQYCLSQEYPQYATEAPIVGTLYILKDLLKGGYKIGISKVIKSRLKQLEVGKKAEVVGLWESPNYSDLERMLHSRYAEYRIPQSEWFALDYDELSNAVDWLNANAIQTECHFQRKLFHINYSQIVIEVLLVLTICTGLALYINHKLDNLLPAPVPIPVVIDLPRDV